jgi:hypothetical protein
VRPGLAGWEADDVARAQHLLAVGLPEDGRAADHQQPLLDAVVVVVGPEPLALLDLVDGAADGGGAQPVADAL